MLKIGRLTLWIVAVLPATLAGHGIAYALEGRSADNAAHAWMQPAWHVSLECLSAVCIAIIALSLLKAGCVRHTGVERSSLELWARLGPSQLALFNIIEHAEGSHVAFSACIVQLAVAFCVACGLSLFARLLSRCAAIACEASRYLERSIRAVEVFVHREPTCIAHVLAVSAGSARFQRPPPLS